MPASITKYLGIDDGSLEIKGFEDDMNDINGMTDIDGSLEIEGSDDRVDDHDDVKSSQMGQERPLTDLDTE